MHCMQLWGKKTALLSSWQLLLEPVLYVSTVRAATEQPGQRCCKCDRTENRPDRGWVWYSAMLERVADRFRLLASLDLVAHDALNLLRAHAFNAPKCCTLALVHASASQLWRRSTGCSEPAPVTLTWRICSGYRSADQSEMAAMGSDICRCLHLLPSWHQLLAHTISKTTYCQALHCWCILLSTQCWSTGQYDPSWMRSHVQFESSQEFSESGSGKGHTLQLISTHWCPF